jgi:hypothetical protein
MMAATKTSVPGPKRSGLRALGPGLVSACLVVGLYFQALILSPGAFWRDPFDGRLILWILEHGRQKLLAGEIARYFQSIQFYPYKNSLAFSESLIGMVPIYTLFRFFADEVISLNLTLMTILVIAALLFDRQLRALGFDPLARLVATIIGLASFPMFCVMGHFQLFGLLFVPAILILIYRIVFRQEQGLYLELCSVALFGSVIAAYLPFMLAFVLVFVAVVFHQRFIGAIRLLTRKDIAFLAAFVALMGAMIYPYYALQKGFGPIQLAEVARYSARLSSLFLLTPANFIYPNLSLEAGDWERSFSPGAVGILCIVLCTTLVVRHMRNTIEPPHRRELLLFCGVVFMVAWGLSLGPYFELFGYRIYTPIGLLQKHIPSLRVIRAPGRYSVFFSLAMAMVFAIGVGMRPLRAKVAVLAAIFLLFQIPRADLFAKETRFIRDDTCLATLTARNVASIVPLASGSHIEWMNARIDNMILMLPYKARIFDGYGNRDTPQIQELTHIERLFRKQEIGLAQYREALLKLGATHLVIRNDRLSAAEASLYEPFFKIDCGSGTVSVRRVAASE